MHDGANRRANRRGNRRGNRRYNYTSEMHRLVFGVTGGRVLWVSQVIVDGALVEECCGLVQS